MSDRTMNLNDDRIEILPITHDLEGNPLEPEERPAQRVIGLESEVAGTLSGPVGSIPASVALEAPVGQFALGFRKQCWSCKHFDNAAWQKVKATWEDGSREQQAALNEMRGALLQTQNAAIRDRIYDVANNDLDLELGLNSFGVCHPITEINSDLVLTFPDGHCPDHLDLYLPKDIEMEKHGSAKFDQIMRAAQGKT